VNISKTLSRSQLQLNISSTTAVPPGESAIRKNRCHPFEKGATVLHIVLIAPPPRMAGLCLADALVIYYASDRRERAISVAFVCPTVCLSVCLSVCPSAAYIYTNNSRTQRSSVPNECSPTLDATRTPVSRSNGQKSWLQTGGGIPCRSNPAATLLVCCRLYPESTTASSSRLF